jgi:hypothetical protein
MALCEGESCGLARVTSDDRVERARAGDKQGGRGGQPGRLVASCGLC